MASSVSVSSLLVLLVTTCMCTYYPNRHGYYNPHRSASFGRAVPLCSHMPAYHITTEQLPRGMFLARPVNPNESFRIALGPADEHGLRIPRGDISLPTDAPAIDMSALIELFQPEADNTSQTQPLILGPQAPTECQLPNPLQVFINALPFVPNALRTASVGAYLYCLSNCPLAYVWKQLPAGYWPRYVRIAYCQSKNCSYPQGMSCQTESTRYITVLRRQCCNAFIAELATRTPSPIITARAVQRPIRGWRKPYYYPRGGYLQRNLVYQTYRRQTFCGYHRVVIPTVSTCRCACPRFVHYSHQYRG